VSIYDYTDDFGSEPVTEQTALTADGSRQDAATGYEGETMDAHEGAVAAADLQTAADESASRTEAAVDAPLDETPAAEPDFTADGPADEPIDDARLYAEPLPDVVEMPESDMGLMRVDFSAWTCVDCVFTTTCERTGDESPSDCGSFQWRPA
jgi:hypothetical protein